MAAKLFGPAGLAVAIGAMTVLLVVFGEVLPMTLAVEHPERYAAWVSRPVAWLSALLWPVRAILSGLTAVTLRLVGSERKQGEPEISEEELRTLVDVGAREGVVDRTEREMIHKVFELEDTLVREVMVPRPDMFCLDVATPPADILPLLREQLHSRVPVFEETVDQIVGVLYTKDLLPLPQAGCPRTSTCARTCTRPTSCPSPSGWTRSCASSRPRSSTWPSWWTSTAARPASSRSRTCSRSWWARSATSSTRRSA